jgi:GAF domain-containing protein
MAVPITLDNVVVGVLDVQSDQVAGLKSNDETLLQSLAQQIAIAVRNARLFDETQMALLRAERLQSLYTGSAWEQFSVGHQLHHFEVREDNLPELKQIDTPEATAALQQERTVSLHVSGNSADTELSAGANTLATPLKLRNRVIGVLGIRDEKNTDRHWSEDEIALIEAVSEQMSQAIENARLFEETGRRAGREKMIADMTQQMWASGDLERVMQTAIQQLGHKLNATKVVIQLGTPEQYAEPTGYDDD